MCPLIVLCVGGGSGWRSGTKASGHQGTPFYAEVSTAIVVRLRCAGHLRQLDKQQWGARPYRNGTTHRAVGLSGSVPIRFRSKFRPASSRWWRPSLVGEIVGRPHSRRFDSTENIKKRFQTAFPAELPAYFGGRFADQPQQNCMRAPFTSWPSAGKRLRRPSVIRSDIVVLCRVSVATDFPASGL